MRIYTKRYSLLALSICTVLAVIAGCATDSNEEREGMDSAEFIDLFASYSADYDVVETGEELAARSDLVIRAEITALRPGPVEVDPENEHVRLENVVVEVQVSNVLDGDGKAPGDVLHVIVPRSAEVADTSVGQGESIAVSLDSIMYLREYDTSVSLPFEDGDWATPLYFTGPQGVAVEAGDGLIGLVFEHGSIIEGDLTDYEPDSTQLPGPEY